MILLLINSSINPITIETDSSNKLLGFEYEKFQPFQEPYIDTFLSNISVAVQNTPAFNELRKGLDLLENKLYKKAERHFNLALLSEGKDAIEMKIFTVIGHLHLIQKAYKKAADILIKALALSKDEVDLAFIYMGIAKVYQFLADYKKSLQYYAKVQWLCTNVLKELKLASLSQINLASLFYDLYKYGKAKKEIEDTLSLFEFQNNPKQLASVYAMLAECLQNERNYEEALLFLNKAFDIAHTQGLLRTAAKILYRMGCIHFKSGNAKKGKTFMDEALIQANEMGDTELSGEILKIYAVQHFNDDQVLDATQYLEQAIKDFKKAKDHSNLEAAYEILVNIYENSGDYKKALNYSRKMAETRWSAFREKEEKEKIATDITKRAKELLHEREINLLNKRNELQSALLEKKRYIELQNQQLQQANEEFTRLAYTAAHDLKQPLRSIGSFTQLLRHSLYEKLEEDDTEYMDFVLDGVTQMDALLKDLLQYCVLKMPDAHLKKTDMNEVLASVQENLATEIQANKVTINSEPLPEILGIDSEMEKLLENIIGNSLKFKSKETPVINVSVESNHKEFVFAVKDNGIGMPSDFCDEAFKLFKCFNPKDRYKGNGIGLSICQKIIFNLRGRIWIESALNEGTTVFFTVPK